MVSRFAYGVLQVDSVLDNALGAVLVDDVVVTGTPKKDNKILLLESLSFFFSTVVTFVFVCWFWYLSTIKQESSLWDRKSKSKMIHRNISFFSWLDRSNQENTNHDRSSSTVMSRVSSSDSLSSVKSVRFGECEVRSYNQVGTGDGSLVFAY